MPEISSHPPLYWLNPLGTESGIHPVPSPCVMLGGPVGARWLQVLACFGCANTFELLCAHMGLALGMEGQQAGGRQANGWILFSSCPSTSSSSCHLSPWHWSQARRGVVAVPWPPQQPEQGFDSAMHPKRPLGCGTSSVYRRFQSLIHGFHTQRGF